MIVSVTKLGKVDCRSCKGRGYHSQYHNDTEDCTICNASGKITAQVPLQRHEMKVAIKRKFGPEAEQLFEIIDLYYNWQQAKT